MLPLASTWFPLNIVCFTCWWWKIVKVYLTINPINVDKQFIILLRINKNVYIFWLTLTKAYSYSMKVFFLSCYKLIFSWLSSHAEMQSGNSREYTKKLTLTKREKSGKHKFEFLMKWSFHILIQNFLNLHHITMEIWSLCVI